MSTTNPRINVTIPSEVAAILKNKADKDKVSVSRLALNLIADAIERDEDIYFSKIAELREKSTKKWINHNDAWK